MTAQQQQNPFIPITTSGLSEPWNIWNDNQYWDLHGFSGTPCRDGIFLQGPAITSAGQTVSATLNRLVHFRLTYEEVQLSSSNGQSVELWGDRDYLASGFENTPCSGGVLWRPSVMWGIRPGTAVGIDFGDPNVEHAD
ncbi:hypothetical protein THAOC_33264, partial [Thalassiosira oceanica]